MKDKKVVLHGHSLGDASVGIHPSSLTLTIETDFELNENDVDYLKDCIIELLDDHSACVMTDDELKDFEKRQEVKK